MDLVGINAPLKGSDLIHNVESACIKFDGDACTTQAIPNEMPTLSAVDRFEIEGAHIVLPVPIVMVFLFRFI